MTGYVVEVSDSAWMQLCLSGLESYRVPRGRKETFSLLWGSMSGAGSDYVHYRVDHVLTDIEAQRTGGWVSYNPKGLMLKKDIIDQCWPSLSFLGDFHTHAYKHYREAENARGFVLSDGDREDVEEINRLLWIREELKVCLLLTISGIKTRGTKDPCRIEDNVVEWTLRNHDWQEHYRLWLSAYVVDQVRIGRKRRLFLAPRESDWREEWLDDAGAELPEHEVWLEVPSVLGNSNFNGLTD